MEKFTFKKRLLSMIKVDFRRMFTTPIYYLMVGVSIIIPILILVMTSMMAGQETTDPVTGEITIMQGFENVWQAIGSIGGATSGLSMDLVSMCNIDMMFFVTAILTCIFVSDDFRSGYCKNLFTVRANKKDYIISKTIICFIGGSSMILGYFIGAMIGGKIAGLPFDLVNGITVTNIIMCMFSKLFLVLIFTSIFLVMSIVGKQRLWLSIMLSLGTSMLLFTMVSMISPLTATIINVTLSLVGGLMFAFGIGAISNLVLKKGNIL